ncbi:MAG: hypothetical protein JWN40_4970 [Phycisphaerales bacterium]|nr:hypothetical protein [Phycisphaerales bacterium]
MGIDPFEQQEALSEEDICELREEIAIGLEQLKRGESAAWDVAKAKAELLERLRGPSGGARASE